MEKDYNEILLQAIDTVVSTRLQNLPYDKTIICTISDDSNRSIGLYEVDDGSATFEVYSDSDSYLLGNQVYVNIPQGDMTQKKHITGRYVSNIENSPIIYVEPLEKVVRLEGGFTTIPGDKPIGIIANSSKDLDKPTVKPIGAVTNLNIDTEISDTLAIRAKFKTDLENVAMTKGSYGLLVELYYTEIVEETDEESGTIQKTVEKMMPVLLDSQQDMFGNVYAYTVPLMQQQAHKFTSPIGSITEIQCSLYERGDFKCLNQDGDEVIYNSQGVENIFVSDIEIYFGADISTVPDNTVKIYTHDPKIYFKSDDENNSLERKISLIWYNKTAENKLLGFDGEFDKEKATKTPDTESALDTKNYYWIEWYRDNLNGSLEKIEFEGEEAQTIVGECELKLPRTEFQARVWLNGTVYKSNVLEFSNTTQPDEETISFMGVELSLTHGEGSQDAYPVYGENGHVINQNDYYKRRTLRLSWSSEKAEIKDEFWKGATITWRIPANSMLRLPTQYDSDEQFITYELTDSYYDENGRLKDEALNFTYCIAERYDIACINNYISCELTFKEEKLNAIKTFAFSARGTYGTDYTIIVKPKDRIFGFTDSAGINLKDNFTAALYDSEYKEIDAKTVKLVSYPKENEEAPNFVPDRYNVIRASAEAEWAGKTVELATLYPVIYSQGGKYCASAPTVITYDAFGVLKNLNAGFKLKLFDSITGVEITEDLIWEVKGGIQAGIEVFKINREENTLIYPATYGEAKNLYPYLVIYHKGIICWTSPLIVQQYRYESEILNNWNGALKVDNENNLIFAGAGVFGNKNEDNSFSGVTLGELKHFESGESAETGVIGFHKGAQSFGFLDNGTAFIGKSGAGRIELDGDVGIIRSSKFDWHRYKDGYDYVLQDGAVKGSIWNLANGDLILQKDENEYFKFTDEGIDIKASKFSLTSGSLINPNLLTNASLYSRFKPLVYPAELEDEAGNAIGWDYNIPIGGAFKLENDKSYVVSCDTNCFSPIFIDLRYQTVVYPYRWTLNENPNLLNEDSELIEEDMEFFVGEQQYDAIRITATAIIYIKKQGLDTPEEHTAYSKTEEAAQWSSEEDRLIQRKVDQEDNSNLTNWIKANGILESIPQGSIFPNEDDLPKLNDSFDLSAFEFESQYALNLYFVFKEPPTSPPYNFWNLKLEEGQQITPWVSDLNFDEKQGIFIEDGQVNINANQIVTGVLASNNLSEVILDDITSIEQGMLIDLDQGIILTPNLGIGDNDNYFINLDRQSGFSVANQGETVLKAQDTGVVITSTEFRHDTPKQDNILYHCTRMPATRNTGSALNIRASANASARVITTQTFYKGVNYYFKNKENKEDSDLDTPNGWYPILLKDDGKVYSGDTNNLPEKIKVGYVYYKGASSSLLFNYNASSTDTDVACVKTIEATNVIGSQINIADHNSHCVMAKNGNTKEYLIIGNDPNASSNDYALQIGTFKVKWNGQVEGV